MGRYGLTVMQQREQFMNGTNDVIVMPEKKLAIRPSTIEIDLLRENVEGLAKLRLVK
jgi:hypothetical protein